VASRKFLPLSKQRSQLFKFGLRELPAPRFVSLQRHRDSLVVVICFNCEWYIELYHKIPVFDAVFCLALWDLPWLGVSALYCHGDSQRPFCLIRFLCKIAKGRATETQPKKKMTTKPPVNFGGLLVCVSLPLSVSPHQPEQQLLRIPAPVP